MIRLLPTIAACGALMVGPAAAQIYVGRDAGPHAAVVLSNFASEATPALLIPASRLQPADKSFDPPPSNNAGVASHLAWPLPSSMTALIGAVAREYAVEEALLKALIAVESGFDPNARSPKGALGLMQLMPATAQRFSVRNAFSIEDNLRGGTAYLRWLLDYFDGNVELALAAYNAGEGAVVRAGRRIPDIAETRAYVPKVLAYKQRFGAAAVASVR